MSKLKPNRENKTPKSTFNTSPAIIVEKEATIQETVNSPHKKISKRIKKNSGRQKKGNTGTRLMVEEENKKHW